MQERVQVVVLPVGVAEDYKVAFGGHRNVHLGVAPLRPLPPEGRLLLLLLLLLLAPNKSSWKRESTECIGKALHRREGL